MKDYFDSILVVKHHKIRLTKTTAHWDYYHNIRLTKTTAHWDYYHNSLRLFSVTIGKQLMSFC